MKYWIFNLKSKLTKNEVIEYEKKIADFKKDIIIAPSYVYLDFFAQHNYKLASQDVSAYPSGNYTGDVNAFQLQSLKVSYVIIGHYERYKFHNEDKQTILAKIKQTLSAGINIILCLYKDDEMFQVLEYIFKSLDSSQLHKIILAYEPLQNISTNQALDDKQINKQITLIRNYLVSQFKVSLPIIYGGSVNLANIYHLKNLDVEGFLIGETSFKIEEIRQILTILK